MNKKCSKYESLFTFSDENTLNQHVQECEECKEEHEQMQKISSLVQEVKPYYKKRRKNTQVFKIACTLLFLIL